MTRRADQPHLRAYPFEILPAALSVHVTRMDPPDATRLTEPHSHQHFEIIYFEEPGGRHRLGASEWETEPGDLVLIAPGEVHRWDPGIRELHPDVWLVAFTAAAVDPSRSEAALFRLVSDPLLYPFLPSFRGESHRLRVPPEERPAWSARMIAFHDELAGELPGYQDALRAHLVLLLVEVMRLSASTDVTAVREQPLLARVFEFIEHGYRTPISLSDVARAVHLSPGHLTSLVRRLTGRTVLEWIIERRLTEARRLLLETDHSVERVGQLVSYVDPTYFIRHFRRAHGTTPAAWRRALRGEIARPE